MLTENKNSMFQHVFCTCAIYTFFRINDMQRCSIFKFQFNQRVVDVPLLNGILEGRGDYCHDYLLVLVYVELYFRKGFTSLKHI